MPAMKLQEFKIYYCATCSWWHPTEGLALSNECPSCGNHGLAFAAGTPQEIYSVLNAVQHITPPR